MTTFIFLRHAQSQANEHGILAGQMPGIHLSKKGQRQSLEIVKALQSMNIDRIITSPLIRCQETIEPFLKASKKRAFKDQGFIEMNYGKWSGRKLSDLAKERDWKLVQKQPSKFKFPSGESFIGAQTRLERRMNYLAKSYPHETLLIISHGDIIKLAAAKSLNMKLDDFQRIVVDPASISVFVWGKKEKTVVSINQSLLKKEKKTAKSKVTNLEKRRVLGGGSGE